MKPFLSHVQAALLGKPKPPKPGDEKKEKFRTEVLRRLGELAVQITGLATTLNTVAQAQSVFATQLAKQGAIMAAGLDELTAEVTAINGTVDSGIALIEGLATRIDELIALGNNDPALVALASELRAKKDALATAVAAHPVV